MQIIAAYVGETRHVLEDSGQILSRANQALATLERYKLRLDEVSSTLSALEIEDLVTVRDVAVVAQRLEMVTRIAREIEDYVLELGTDGRLLALQLEELITGVDLERELVIRDYVPGGRRGKQPEVLLQRLEALSATELVDPGVRGAGARPRQRRAPRRRGRPARLPAAGQGAAAATRRGRPAGRPLRHAAEAALGRRRGPPGRRGRRRAARPQRPRGALPAGRVDDPRAVRLARLTLARVCPWLSSRDGFDPAYYLLAHGEVAEAGMDPADHYRQFGHREGRTGVPPAARPHAREREAEGRAAFFINAFSAIAVNGIPGPTSSSASVAA